MALMFSRLARNFAKNGYYPTDELSLERLLQAVNTTATNVAILDPCCGEGSALADLKRHLREAGADVRAYGIEYNSERAWHAKQLLDVVAHADVHDMAICRALGNDRPLLQRCSGVHGTRAAVQAVRALCDQAQSGPARELSQLQRATLWPQFSIHFGGSVQQHRPPLRKLSNWHLALALAAGQISGVVTSTDGRTLLIKGDTFKDKVLKVTFEEVGKNGEQREVRTFTDRFVPTIRAIDFTPGPMFGHLVTIQ